MKCPKSLKIRFYGIATEVYSLINLYL